MNRRAHSLLGLTVLVAAALVAGAASGQDDAGRVNALLTDLKSPDFETASGAVEQLRRYPQHRARIVRALIDAVRTRNWNRCAGDMRDTIARVLAEWKAREAVVRASAVYALGRIGGPAIIPTIRKAVEESMEYERELDRRRQRGEAESVLRERYGLGSYDLRETLQQAIESAQQR